MSAVIGSAGTPASRRLMPVLFIGVFMAALDTAVIAPAIPALREALARLPLSTICTKYRSCRMSMVHPAWL